MRGVKARLTSDRGRVWSGGSMRSIEKVSVSVSSMMPFSRARWRFFSKPSCLRSSDEYFAGSRSAASTSA